MKFTEAVMHSWPAAAGQQAAGKKPKKEEKPKKDAKKEGDDDMDLFGEPTEEDEVRLY